MSDKNKKENEENNEEENNEEENKVDRKDMLICRLEDKDYSTLKDDIEQVVSKKIHERVQAKKQDVINKMNGVSTEEKDEDE